MRRRATRFAHLVVASHLLAFVAPGWAAEDAASRQRGQAYFLGEAVLAGRLSGHAMDLPSVASRCVNCHRDSADARAASARAAGNTGLDPSADAGAPPLGRAWLTQWRSRRFAPASRYDAASLCTLLRSGVDPAMVVIPATMPRYQASDAQCADLWNFLMSMP